MARSYTMLRLILILRLILKVNFIHCSWRWLSYGFSGRDAMLKSPNASKNRFSLLERLPIDDSQGPTACCKREVFRGMLELSTQGSVMRGQGVPWGNLCVRSRFTYVSMHFGVSFGALL